MQIARVPERGKVATPKSMNASFNGAVTDGLAYLIERLSSFSIVASVTETSASLAGTLKLQISNNAFKDATSNTERSDAVWVDLASSSFTLTAGSDTYVWNFSYASYEAVRLVWTRTSGQGTVSAYFIAKE